MNNIIEYNKVYDNDLKELFYELQEYIMSIDQEGYNIINKNNKDDYYKKVMNEINTYQGKILLYKEDNKIVGLIVGYINNEETNEIDFIAPKRGRISELIVTKSYRGKHIGQKLFTAMEKYLKEQKCESILIGVFAYNEQARKFYEKNGYHLRMTDMIKV